MATATVSQLVAEQVPGEIVPGGIVPNELAVLAAALSGNGVNAAADNPEDAETLAGRALRPDAPRRTCSATPDEAAAVATGAAEAEEASRGTPGMAQPGSVMSASLRPPLRPRYQPIMCSIIVPSTDIPRANIDRDEVAIRRRTGGARN